MEKEREEQHASMKYRIYCNKRLYMIAGFI